MNTKKNPGYLVRVKNYCTLLRYIVVITSVQLLRFVTVGKQVEKQTVITLARSIFSLVSNLTKHVTLSFIILILSPLGKRFNLKNSMLMTYGG